MSYFENNLHKSLSDLEWKKKSALICGLSAEEIEREKPFILSVIYKTPIDNTNLVYICTALCVIGEMGLLRSALKLSTQPTDILVSVNKILHEYFPPTVPIEYLFVQKDFNMDTILNQVPIYSTNNDSLLYHMYFNFKDIFSIADLYKKVWSLELWDKSFQQFENFLFTTILEYSSRLKKLTLTQECIEILNSFEDIYCGSTILNKLNLESYKVLRGLDSEKYSIGAINIASLTVYKMSEEEIDFHLSHISFPERHESDSKFFIGQDLAHNSAVIQEKTESQNGSRFIFTVNKHSLFTKT